MVMSCSCCGEDITLDAVGGENLPSPNDDVLDNDAENTVDPTNSSVNAEERITNFRHWK